MKLGLLGYPINHSLSPKLYNELLGPQLSSYELFSYPTPSEIPGIEFFSSKLDGLNITSPYKAHFLSSVEIDSELVKSLGAINTISFRSKKPLATNTDLIAVDEILGRFQNMHSKLKLILLGDGAMARLTKIVADSKNIPVHQFSRKRNDFSNLDLQNLHETGVQTIIINSCSRDYVFNSKVSGDEIFWDYNYSFLPHQNTLPSLVKTYIDGQEMLLLQAKAAINFWSQVK